MVDYSKYECLKVEISNQVATVILNRPEELNNFDRTLHSEVESIFHEISFDETVNAIVLTGAGTAFSAGGNIKEMQKGMSTAPPPEECISLINNLLKIKQPIIAALNGHAVGLGATLALFCDIVIASSKAKIGDPHVSVGLVAGDGGCVIWPLLIGMTRAKEMLLTGKLINSEKAEQIGLINYSVPSEEVMPKAMRIANSLANGPAKAIQWTKMSINKKLLADVNLILPTSIGFEYLSMNTEEHKEAVAAFIEKRKPEFTKN
jgi:enoyl-CoA hydratase/carnithine racemase